MTGKLATEQETYQRSRDALLGTHEGKFVVLHGDRVLAAFDCQADAIWWGYRELGNVPFLVKQVVKVEAPLGFAPNLLL